MRLDLLAAVLCAALLAPGCAGVTAADLQPHVATARDLAERNNAAIAEHCASMDTAARQQLMRDNVDHAAQLAALQEAAGEGPGWLSNVIAWALSFSRLAGIVAADGPDDDRDQALEPPAELPDDDGDGTPEGGELGTLPCPCGCCEARAGIPAISAGSRQLCACDCPCQSPCQIGDGGLTRRE